MDYAKGEEITVLDGFGELHQKIVWESFTDSLSITSKNNFQKLEEGTSSVNPITVPLSCVVSPKPALVS